MFQKNFAVKQTEGLRKRPLEFGEFLAREPMWPPVFSRPFSGHVFQVISTCAIFFCIRLPSFMESR